MMASSKTAREISIHLDPEDVRFAKNLPLIRNVNEDRLREFYGLVRYSGMYDTEEAAASKWLPNVEHLQGLVMVQLDLQKDWGGENHLISVDFFKKVRQHVGTYYSSRGLMGDTKYSI
mgnify:CR=1 FL=1